MTKRKSAYARAGVDIDQMMTSISAIKRMLRGTAIKGVMSDVGSFGGLFAAPGKDHVLVASTDGVGTKLMVAHQANRHDTVGQDLVNHCVNDILVQGARPLFFLDYLGTAKLRGDVFRDVIKGLCRACRQNGCALLGGETAEMPGLYPAGAYDLVGTIIGTVEKRRLVTGKSIRAGDAVIGLPSSGLHTNGFSLARKIIFDQAGLGIHDTLPGTRRSVADVLLAVHRTYLSPVSHLLDSQVKVHGMAHLTGGGFQDNIPRILPGGVIAVVDRDTWPTPPLFRFIREHGKISEEELFRVFNMGIGFVVVVRKRDAEGCIRLLKKHRCAARLIGRIEDGKGGLAWA